MQQRITLPFSKKHSCIIELVVSKKPKREFNEVKKDQYKIRDTAHTLQ